jgi:beta-lactamase regulating signal transducer with metallopeptidase domain
MSAIPLRATAVAALSMVPAVALLLAAAAAAPGLDHVMGSCPAMVNHGGAVPLLLAAALAVSMLLRGLGCLLFQAVVSARAVRIARGSAVLAPPAVSRLARRLGIERLVVTELGPDLAFCAGVVRPSVVVSRDLLERLPAPAVAAILAHESAHARMRDPLRQVLGHAAARALWIAPVASALAARQRLRRELHADADAVRQVGRRALAAALLALNEPAAPLPVGVAAGDALLGHRVAALSSGSARATLALPFGAILRTGLGIAAASALAALVLVPGLAEAAGLGCCLLPS